MKPTTALLPIPQTSSSPFPPGAVVTTVTSNPPHPDAASTISDRVQPRAKTKPHPSTSHHGLPPKNSDITTTTESLPPLRLEPLARHLRRFCCPRLLPRRFSLSFTRRTSYRLCRAGPLRSLDCPVSFASNRSLPPPSSFFLGKPTHSTFTKSNLLGGFASSAAFAHSPELCTIAPSSGET